MASRSDLAVVGGAGHVGLPLSILFAQKGKRVLIHDINTAALDTISHGRLPFLERDAEPLLKAALAAGRVQVSDDPASLAGIPILIVTIGTPIDEFLNPATKSFVQCFERLLPHLSAGQLVVLRSTIYPGETDWLDQYLRQRGKRLLVAYCPERIVQGHAIEELQSLPQIVSGTTPPAAARAAQLFRLFTTDIVRLEPMEAEFAKLFCNAYRYIQFAATNQFYMMAHSAGLDYYRVLAGMKTKYARMRDLPGAGLSAGPCLLKDTMQLSAFYNNTFSLGTTAMLINEGLPLYVVDHLAQQYDLSQLTVGLLGMAFKAESDDPRSSLSYKLKKVLRFRAKRVLTTDPYVQDPELRPLEEVIAQSDLLILCIPHQVYRNIELQGKPVVDIWNFFDRGGRIVAGQSARQAQRARRRPASIRA